MERKSKESLPLLFFFLISLFTSNKISFSLSYCYIIMRFNNLISIWIKKKISFLRNFFKYLYAEDFKWRDCKQRISAMMQILDTLHISPIIFHWFISRQFVKIVFVIVSKRPLLLTIGLSWAYLQIREFNLDYFSFYLQLWYC